MLTELLAVGVQGIYFAATDCSPHGVALGLRQSPDRGDLVTVELPNHGSGDMIQ